MAYLAPECATSGNAGAAGQLARFGVPGYRSNVRQLLDWLVDDPAIHSELQTLGARWSDYGPAIWLQGLTLQQKRRIPGSYGCGMSPCNWICGRACVSDSG